MMMMMIIIITIIIIICKMFTILGNKNPWQQSLDPISLCSIGRYASP